MDQLRGLIEARRQALIAELREDAERTQERQYGELAGPAPDSGDESVAALIADLEQAGLSRDLGELRGLEAARARIADGSYGTCIDCGGDIEFERLRANPGALRCVDCQRIHEKTYAGSGRPTL
jgi:RNA polymerase-binding transcription factor DksA